MSPATTVAAQVDQGLASRYFEEVKALCEREGGRLWGVPLYGPMVIADPTTGSIASNQPVPDEEPPRGLGFTNSVVEWGGTRWATYIWQGLPSDDAHRRSRLLIHELFHRIQPELNLMTTSGPNDHLDTPEGRYWMQLEWRALGRALKGAGPERAAAIADALSFRAARRKRFESSFESERAEEIREGLAQYTGTVVAAGSHGAAVASAIDQLEDAAKQPTFVKTFAYPSGIAYGAVLDDADPGWTRRIRATDDLGQKLMASAGVSPSENAASAAVKYDGPALWAAEQRRGVERSAFIATLRERFVEGPVVAFPGGGRAELVTTGATPIPNVGTYYPSYRLESKWGTLEASGGAVVANDGNTVTAPARHLKKEGAKLSGDGWTATLEPGWVIHEGDRAGDFRVVRREH